MDSVELHPKTLETGKAYKLCSIYKPQLADRVLGADNGYAFSHPGHTRIMNFAIQRECERHKTHLKYTPTRPSVSQLIRNYEITLRVKRQQWCICVQYFRLIEFSRSASFLTRATRRFSSCACALGLWWYLFCA